MENTQLKSLISG